MTGDGLQRKLGDAVALHQTGRLDDAERIYRQVLRRTPRNDDALHLLGLLRHQKGDHQEAERLIVEAVRIRPSAVAYYENLAVIQRTLGKLAAVADTCRRGLAQGRSERLPAALIEALLGLGQFQEMLGFLDELDRQLPPNAGRLADRAHCLLQLGRLDAAADAAGKALALDAANANARSVLAGVATQRGDHAGAATQWREILRLQPEWSAALVNLGLSLVRANDAGGALSTLDSGPLPNDPLAFAALLNVRAAAHRQLRQPVEAAKSLRQALAVWPAAAEYLSNLSELTRAADAMAALRLVDRALACQPLLPGAHDNRGLALAELDRLGEAVIAHHRAIALAPNDAAILTNLTDPLRWYCLGDEAERLYRRSIAIDPSFAPAAYGLGTLQLFRGDFANGWAGYEHRFEADPHSIKRPFALPKWDGGPLPGRLLVWGEQGVGDELIYSSMLPDLPRAGISAIVECEPRLVSLMARSMPDITFVARANPPDPRLGAGDIVAQIAMASLGGRLRRRLGEFGPVPSYLRPRPDLLAHWRGKLAAFDPGPKIGFAWRSRRDDALARRFHPPIEEWAPVLRQPGVSFVSLQYGEVSADIERARAMTGVTIHQFADLDLFDDFEGVLALSAALDLVVSTRTTAFCPAAGTGTPVWLATPENDHFRFGTDDIYPWFPQMRAHIRAYKAPWRQTFERIAADLADYVATSPVKGRESR